MPAAAQETTEERPFSGIYIGAAGGYDVQGNDVGSSIQFDRNLDGTFGDQVSTIGGANAFSPGFCVGAAAGAQPTAGCAVDDNGIDSGGRGGYAHRE